MDVKTPAFSLTKVQAGIGALIGAVTGALPPALGADETIWVAAIAAGTLVMLGVFGLAAVDLIARQRAAEATLRYGPGKTAEARFVALPKSEDLRMQVGANTVEYKLKMLEVEGDEVTLIGRANGQTHTEAFQRSSKN